MKNRKRSLFSNQRGGSYAISATIITAATIALVLVTTLYTYQILDEQSGAAEFDAVTKSVLIFDDAIRDVAWDRKSARSARFTIGYGQLGLRPNSTWLGLPLVVNVTSYPNLSYSTYTGFVRYSIHSKYVNLGEGYGYYLLGDNVSLISDGTASFGRAFVEQKENWVNLTLSYRVRAMRTTVVEVGENTVNYVDITIVKLVVPQWSTAIHDFDLTARNLGLNTTSFGPYDVSGGGCSIQATLGSSTTEIAVDLVPGKVVFNFVVAEVQVST